MRSKKSGTRLDASKKNGCTVRLRQMLLLPDGFTTGAAQRTKRQRAGGSRAPSGTASLSSVLSSVLEKGKLLDDGPRAANVDDEVWAEFKTELNARHLKTGLGVQGMLSKFVADKRSRPPPSRSAGPGATDKHTNLLRRLTFSMPSLPLTTLEDCYDTHNASWPSAVPLAGRRASASESTGSTGSHGRKVAEIGLRRSDCCPFDLGLADLDGQHASLDSVNSAGSLAGPIAELAKRHSCPANVGLLVEWGETDDDGLSREEEDSLNRFCNAEWEEDEAEEDVDVTLTDVFEALQEGDPPGGKGLEDCYNTHNASWPSAVHLAGRRASANASTESTVSHGRKVAEIGLRRSDRCPFDLGLADLDGQHASLDSVNSAGSLAGRIAELALRHSCPANVGLLVEWGEPDGNGLSREEEDSLSRFCNAEWEEDEAEEDVDVTPTDVFEALQEGDPPGGKGREEEVTAVDTEGETGLNGVATYLSLMNESMSFMQHKMENSGTTQGREEANNRGIEPRVVPAVEGSDRKMIVTPGSDLFSRYLENKATSRTGTAKSVTHGSNEDATPLALPATRSPGLCNGSPAKNAFQAGHLLVEWGDTTTATTEEEEGGEGKKTDMTKNETYKWVDINLMEPNPESWDQGERAVVWDGHAGLEHRCTKIGHRKASCRMSDLTFVEAADMVAELSVPLVLRKRIRSLPITEDGLLVAPRDGLQEFDLESKEDPTNGMVRTLSFTMGEKLIRNMSSVILHEGVNREQSNVKTEGTPSNP